MTRNRRGFTLLELVIVVGILAALATAAMLSVGQLDDQTRFEDTKARASRLRQAIVGTGALVDGSASVQGFVADMGRLPASLDELVEILPIGQATQPPYVAMLTFESPPGTTWNAGFGGGWRGPYVIGEPDLVATWFPAGTFRDGWGNRSANDALATPDRDFGWRVALDAAVPPALTITSLALGNTDEATPPTSWAQTNFKTTIVPDDYLVRVQSWTIDVELRNVGTTAFGTPGAPRSVAVALYFHVNGVIDRKVSLAHDVDVAASETRTFTFTFALATDERIPIGIHSFALVDGATQNVIGSPAVQQPVSALFSPRANLPRTIRWTVSP